jgi:benzoylformate decarboxylase
LPSVRDVTLDLLRERRLTRIFANPGSTEVPFLTAFPPDFDFVLGLHESAVVGMATGWAIAKGEPALVMLHTTAGLGNAVGALATARVNRAPLLVLVGQQHRRHLEQEPFLAGRLRGLAGEYPVSVAEPVRAQDVPALVDRAWHAARTQRGPAIVIVPLDDWQAEAGETHELVSPREVRRGALAAADDVDSLAALLGEAERPALVAGALADSSEGWSALVALAERLDCPVWQESFGARAGFPQDHPLFAGHLPGDRSRLREVLAGHDVVLSIGAPVFRQFRFEPGPLVEPGTRLALVTDDAAEAHRAPAELALVADVADVCRRLADRLPQRTGRRPTPKGPRPGSDPGHGPNSEKLLAEDVLRELAQRLPDDAVVFEETPSSKPALHALVRIRAPLGFLSPAMGGLGFALPAAAGVRMALPDRPVVAVVGDGSSLYSIQSLWSAQRYRCGVLYVVLNNGGYAVMDRLAEAQLASGRGPWPAIDDVDYVALAGAFGCESARVETVDELRDSLGRLLPTLARREQPFLLEARVEPGESFEP